MVCFIDVCPSFKSTWEFKPRITSWRHISSLELQYYLRTRLLRVVPLPTHPDPLTQTFDIGMRDSSPPEVDNGVISKRVLCATCLLIPEAVGGKKVTRASGVCCCIPRFASTFVLKTWVFFLKRYLANVAHQRDLLLKEPPLTFQSFCLRPN